MRISMIRLGSPEFNTASHYYSTKPLLSFHGLIPEPYAKPQELGKRGHDILAFDIEVRNGSCDGIPKQIRPHRSLKNYQDLVANRESILVPLRSTRDAPHCILETPQESLPLLLLESFAPL